MKVSCRRLALMLLASFAATATFGLPRNAEAGGQVTIGVTETIASYNPYADSISMGYAIWCQVYGCLGIYDYEKGDYVGMLVDRWGPWNESAGHAHGITVDPASGLRIGGSDPRSDGAAIGY